MTGQKRFSTMRRVNPKTAAWCSGLLVIVQMVTGPVAHPMSGFIGGADCEHAAALGTPQIGGDCADCPPAPDQSPAGSPQDHSGTSEPKGPTFSPPLFDVLRPPN
jgi:hypothetical protein